MLRIDCVGPGAIGSLVSFHLRSQGHPLTFILRRPQAQHRDTPPSLSLQLESHSATRSVDGIQYEFVHAQNQQPIDCLLVTTKAHQLVRALEPLVHRLSRFSTIVLLHNGLGVLEQVLERCFPLPHFRPSFILANTSHGVYKVDSGAPKPSHGRFCHSGIGDLKLGVLPNQTVLDSLAKLGSQDHWYPSSNDHRPHAERVWPSQPLALSSDSNPLINPSLDIPPNLEQHLPHLEPETHSLHHTLSALLQPELVDALGTKWLTLRDFQTSALIKLTVNAALNPLTALLETRNEALAGEPAFGGIAAAICAEASAAFAHQAGHPKGFALHHPLNQTNLLRQVGQVQRATGPNISSMCADIRKLACHRISGQLKRARLKMKSIRDREESAGTLDKNEKDEGVEETEIEYINGYISRLGAKYGVLTPVNDCLLQLVQLKTSAIVTDQRLPPLQRPHHAHQGPRDETPEKEGEILDQEEEVKEQGVAK